VGDQAPDFSVTGLDGMALTKADLAAEDKAYVLYFFATW
jgi:peroxiredoxin